LDRRQVGRRTDPEYDSIDYRTMQRAVTDHLRSAILSGQIGPGERLHQDDLSKRLGVSRMPIREALRILESEGLIEMRPHRGAVVVDLQPEDIVEIFEIRAMLEAKAAELAAPRLSDSTIAQMRQILDEMSQTTADEERWLQLNQVFHVAIYPACGWPRLCNLIETQRNVVQPYLRAALALTGRTSSAHEEHLQIMRAAEDRDGERLARYTVEHLRATARGLVAFLAERRRNTINATELPSGVLRSQEASSDSPNAGT